MPPQNEEEVRRLIWPALQSKCEEFEMCGCAAVTEEELWEYCARAIWRRVSPADLPVHRLVRDVLSVAPASYFARAQVEEFKSVDWFSPVNEEELNLLLNRGACER